MKILDGYIMRSFLFSYFVCFFALTGLYVVLESFQITGRLIEDDKEWADILVTLPKYAAYKTPMFFYQVAPAVNLMAAIFTLVALSRNNEIVPIKSAGISVFRVFVPIFALAVGGAILVAVDQEVIVPVLRDRIRDIDSQVHDKWRNERRRVLRDDAYGNRIFVSYYNIAEKQIRDIDITQFYGETQAIKMTAHAKEAYWKRSVDGVERWHLSDGTLQTLDRYETSIRDTKTFMAEGLVLLREGDEPAQDGRLYIKSDLTPEMVEEEQTLEIELLSTSELISRSRKGYISPEILVSIQRRFSWPLATVILLFTGLPFAVSSEGRGVFSALGMCLVISFAFFIIEMVCRQLGEAGSLSSYLAGWLPAIIFGAFGLYMFEEIKT